MASMTLNQYFQNVGKILNKQRLTTQHGRNLAQLLSIQDAHAYSPKLLSNEPEYAVQNVFPPPWDDVIIAHLKCIYAITNYGIIEAYKSQRFLIQSFTKILQGMKEENWALPVMYTCCLDLRRLAMSACSQPTHEDFSEKDDLEKAADLFMGLFRVCAADNRSELQVTKRWGTLFLINQLLKIYFKVNKVHLVKPLIRAIDNSNLKDSFPTPQQVTYRYFIGQKAMFESNFEEAQQHLSYAFRNCPSSFATNKRRILIYLIPVKMLLGIIPSEYALMKYDLMQFSDVVRHFVSGNLAEFDKALEANETFFIHCGIYLILKRLKNLAFRNLFKRVYLIVQNHVISIAWFTHIVKKLQGDEICNDEVLCVLANLIFENKIKGYISHKQQKLVLSKTNAFPPLHTIGRVAL